MSKGNELEERLRTFVRQVTRRIQEFPRKRGAGHVGDQLFRAATGARSHYAEARGAESRDDFVHKLSLVIKELREVKTWLDSAIDLCLIDEAVGQALWQEADELVAIFWACRRTAKDDN